MKSNGINKSLIPDWSVEQIKWPILTMLLFEVNPLFLFRYVENAVVLRFMRWASCYIIFILDLLFSPEIIIEFVILGLPNLICCGIFVKIKSDEKK